ncbi:MAG TPA: prepilin-type N-terminal cleavage/methylation domain-containing protein [Thermodesulfobacteriota bacterium]|nr:prepilin-type N-terminal cleavage/methylation domain-containing protein [Thermodesulfobacteriota bacterium]
MKSKGFSLMELVIVLTILVLSVSLVTSSMSNLSRTIELKAAAKKVSGILRYYRSEAINKGLVYQVLFDSESRAVKVQSVSLTEPGDETETAEKKGGDGVKTLYGLPEGVRMKDLDFPSPEYPCDLPAVEFYPNGGSNGGSVLLNSPERKGYRIKIHFITGAVEVEKSL